MVGARGLCSLSGRKIDSESAWGIRNLHIGCWVSGRVLSWSLIDFLRPEQGWQCERQMVPLGVALTSPGSSQHINKKTGPSQRGLGSGSYQPGRRAGECGRHRRVGDREQSDFWEWWEGRCVLVEVQSSIHMSQSLLPG